MPYVIYNGVIGRSTHYTKEAYEQWSRMANFDLNSPFEVLEKVYSSDTVWRSLTGQTFLKSDFSLVKEKSFDDYL